MNKKGIIAEKMGFYIAYIFLFALAISFALVFMVGSTTEFDSDEIEDSIVATRVLSCFSDGEIGVINEEEFNLENLKKCFSEGTYFFKIRLDKEEKKGVPLIVGEEFGYYRTSKRYVKLKEGEGVLEIGYVKNY